MTGHRDNDSHHASQFRQALMACIVLCSAITAGCVDSDHAASPYYLELTFVPGTADGAIEWNSKLSGENEAILTQLMEEAAAERFAQSPLTRDEWCALLLGLYSTAVYQQVLPERPHEFFLAATNGHFQVEFVEIS